MMRVEMRVGRLLEVRAYLPIRVEEIPKLVKTLAAIYERAPRLVVAILDARAYGVEPPETVKFFIEAIKRDNPRIERSAFLIEQGQNLLGLQLDRVIREAGNPNRRLFRDVPAATAFLSPSLNEEERTRLDTFLTEPTSDPPASVPR
jgi:hypothetical protein